MNPDKLQQAIDLYDRFTHEGMDRRDFFARMTLIAGSAAAATSLIASIAASPAAAAIVPADDKRLTTRTMTFDRPAGYKAYVAEPRTRSLKATVLVIHENRGLTDHIRDVARRIAPGRLPRGRAGLPVAVRRHPGQRGCGARRDRQARPRQGHVGRRDDAGRAVEIQPRRQGRRGRLLLGRSLRQPIGGCRRRQARCRRGLLRPGSRSVGGDQGPGAAADPPRRASTSAWPPPSSPGSARFAPPASRSPTRAMTAPITPSTTTRRPSATTRKPPTWRGAGRSASSSGIWA